MGMYPHLARLGGGDSITGLPNSAQVLLTVHKMYNNLSIVTVIIIILLNR